MHIGPSALSAECTQVRKICCALSAECTPELGVMSAVQSAVVHCVWSYTQCTPHRPPWASLSLSAPHPGLASPRSSRNLNLKSAAAAVTGTVLRNCPGRRCGCAAGQKLLSPKKNLELIISSRRDGAGSAGVPVCQTEAKRTGPS